MAAEPGEFLPCLSAVGGVHDREVVVVHAHAQVREILRELRDPEGWAARNRALDG